MDKKRIIGQQIWPLAEAKTFTVVGRLLLVIFGLSLKLQNVHAQSVTTTYTSATTFTVPVGVTSIRINAWGGGGGSGGQDCGAGCTNASPSQVGYVIANYSVTSGNIVYLYPGGKGGNGSSEVAGTGGGAGGAATYPTGYDGGRGGNAGGIGTSGGGGGGGAATVVAIGTSNTIRIVAGGGGGGGGMANKANSGEAGVNLTSSSGSTNGGAGSNAGSSNDGGGGGGGGGGDLGSDGGVVYNAVSSPAEVAGRGGYRGNNFVSGGTSVSNTTTSWTSAGKVEITYTAVGGTASSNQTICSGTQPANITLSGYAGTVQWQVSTNNSTWTNISGATDAILTSAQMGTLTAIRYYRAFVSGVAYSNAVTVSVTAANTVGAASSTPTLCINTALTNITHMTIGATGIGTAIGLPAGVSAAWASNTITISGTPTQSGTFSYTIPVTGGCGSVSASGTITVNPTPTVTAVSNQTYCNNESATTTVLSGPVAGTTFTWTNSNTAIGLAASGTGDVPAFTASNSTAAAISATITITPTANGCTGTASNYTITVNPSPTASNAGTDLTIPLTGVTLAANNPVAGSGAWSVVSGPGTSSSQFANTASYNSVFTPSAGKGTYVLRWTISNGTCSSSDELSLRVVDDVWNGSSNSQWNNGSNWESGTAPTGGSGIEIAVKATASRDINLDADKTLSTIDFNGVGIKLVLGNFNLTVTSVIGSGASSYVKTNGIGKIKMTVANAAAQLFPVGTSYYSPVTITNNTGGSSEFYVTTSDGIFDNGGTSGNRATTSPRVDLTWNIGNATNSTGSGTVDLLFEWNSAIVVGSLVSPKLYHYDGTQWQMQGGATTVSLINGTLNYSGYSGSFSPFSLSEGMVPLPVTWLSFSAKLTGESVGLQWATAYENGNSHFEVERSSNALDFIKIGQVKSLGNDVLFSKYQFTDAQPLNGTAYYRLKQVDLDGDWNYSKILSINRLKQSAIAVFSVLESGKIILQIPSEDEGLYEVRIFDAVAQLVYKGKTTIGQNSIDMSEINKGVYFVTITKENIVVYSGKIINQ